MGRLTARPLAVISDSAHTIYKWWRLRSHRLNGNGSSTHATVEITRPEGRYRDLVDTIPHGIEEISTTGTIIFANAADHKQYGYADGELIGKSILDLVPTSMERDQLRERLAYLVENQPHPTRYFRQAITKSGELFDIQVDWDYHRVAGHVAGFTAVITDVSEQKLAQEAERRHIQETSMVAEIGRILNSSLHIEEVYPKFSLEMSKLMPLDYINISEVDVGNNTATVKFQDVSVGPIHATGDILSLDGTVTQEVAKSRSAVLVHVGDRDDVGQLYPGLLAKFDAGMRSFLSVPVISDDQVTRVLNIGVAKPKAYTEQDVALAGRIAVQISPTLENAHLYAEARHAEQAERKRSEELGVLFDVATILAKGGSFEQKTASVMDKLAQFTGADWVTLRLPDETEQELRLMAAAGSAAELSHPVPVLSDKETRAFRAFKEGKPIVTNDYDAEANASPKLVALGMKSMVLIPVKAGGRTLGLVNVVSQHPNQFPPEQVRILTAIVDGVGGLIANARLDEIQKGMEEKLQESARLASLGELAAGVAHEINNPLTVVLGYSEMALKLKYPGVISEYIQNIHDQARRAARIVQNLLFCARRSDSQRQYLDLNSVVERALEMMSYDFTLNNIQVSNQLSPEIPKTMVDEHQLIQVLLNILTNAEQATRQAGGKGEIEICTKISGDDIEITVKDNGPGIPSEVLDRIFEPFFTTKEVGQGTGLGLSISYGIIKQHGGEIWADSVEGGDTTFHITLPVVGTEETSVIDWQPWERLDKTTKHLLVVDDEPHIRDILKWYLELERYTVDLAEDGQEAWRKLANMDYDCILLDLNMPGMSGPKLYQLIQGISRRLASKVVFITGNIVSPDTQKFISNTGNRVVTKPFRPEELLGTVQNLWENLPFIYNDLPKIGNKAPK